MSTTVFTRRDRAAIAAQTNAPAEAVQAPVGSSQRTASRLSAIVTTIPTALVLLALAGIALVGHRTEWKLPKFSALWAGPATVEEAWCQEHNVPEAECIECNVLLLPAGSDYGWCSRHGVSNCPLEHPDVAELPHTPTVTPASFERADRALLLLPRTENNSRCKLHQRRIQLASAETGEKAGIDIDVVVERPVVEAIVANGELAYDQTRSAHLASRVAGTVWRVERQVGDHVRRGDVLALIDAAEVGRAKSDFLQAVSLTRLKQTNVERLVPLVTSGSVPERQYREAEAALSEAQIRLLTAQQMLVNLGLQTRAEEFAGLTTQEIARRIQFLGLPAAMASRLNAESTTSNLFPLCAPLDGLVIDRRVVPGEVVADGSQLFAVANVDRMWLTLDVRQEDARYAALGQAVLFQPSDGHKDEEFQGSVAWISTSADDRTRTVKIRVDLPNTSSCLRAGTFGTGRIVLRRETAAIVVPTEAVHSDGCCSVVFVRDRNYLQAGAPKFFHVRPVRLGCKDGDKTEILVGLLPGEIIASKNSVVLQAQLLRCKLGEGCGCCSH